VRLPGTVCIYAVPILISIEIETWIVLYTIGSTSFEPSPSIIIHKIVCTNCTVCICQTPNRKGVCIHVHVHECVISPSSRAAVYSVFSVDIPPGLVWQLSHSLIAVPA
jgi:hypothetical protein